MDALKAGKDIGHCGRLTFAIVAGNFMSGDELVKLLAKQPNQDQAKALALVQQVRDRDYNPPKRERILERQAQQDFPIWPTPNDPAICNVYREQRFPEACTIISASSRRSKQLPASGVWMCWERAA